MRRLRRTGNAAGQGMQLCTRGDEGPNKRYVQLMPCPTGNAPHDVCSLQQGAQALLCPFSLTRQAPWKPNPEQLLSCSILYALLREHCRLNLLVDEENRQAYAALHQSKFRFQQLFAKRVPHPLANMAYCSEHDKYEEKQSTGFSPS